MNRPSGKDRSIRKELSLIGRRAGQVWRLLPRRHRWALGGAAALMALTSICNTAIPLVLGNLIDQVRKATEHTQTTTVLSYFVAVDLGLIAGAYLLREALNVLRRYWVENSCTRIERDMIVKVVHHLFKVELTSFSSQKTGALQGRIVRSVDGFVRFLRLGFLTFFPAVVTGLFALLASVSKQPWLGVAMAGVVPVSVWLTVWQLRSQKGVRLQLLAAHEEMDGMLTEQLTGIDYVRAANTHEHEVRRVSRTAERRRVKEVRHHFEMSLFGAGKAINEGLFHILVLGLGVWLAVQGQISIGDILTFSVLFLNVMAPLNEIHRVIDEGHESSLQVGDLLKMLAEPTDRSFATPPGPAPRLAMGDPVLTVADLQLEYVSDKGHRCQVLKGVNLEIRHGETIGVAGRSGCGKTTWLKVLLRLIHATGGRVHLAGQPLESISRGTIGELIGYVGQSPFIFCGTIAENIAYGCGDVAQEAIERAARLAHIHDEILGMSHGYDTKVTERGQNLSGGQRQRLALARIFLKDPPILILDEGTSALDTISERRVQQALAEARQDRTVILVAHRLSTLFDADRIVVFDKGRIAEVGDYGELVRSNGVFADLVHSAQQEEVAAVCSTARPADTLPPAEPEAAPAIALAPA
jgi:ATP-binding cassette subfamily B protein